MNIFTKENHFRFGYNRDFFNLRKSVNDLWNVKYGRCEREPFDFRRECIETAKLIRKQTTLPINILFSGGIDSEIIVRSFIEANIPITCIIGKFKNNYNLHDISYAISFCKNNNVEFKEVEVDLINFWKNDLLKYTDKTYCISPQFPVIMSLVDKIDAYSIIGSGECYLINDNNIWYLVEKEKVASFYRYFLLTNKEGAPGFFQYTPELMLSFLENDILKTIINSKEAYSDTYKIKPQIYKKMWPDLIERQKYTGFEKLKHIDLIYRKKLENLYPNCGSVVKTEYSKLINCLAPIAIKEVTKQQLLQYKNLYDNEGLNPLKTPFPNIDFSCYFIAFIRDKIAGITAFDVLKDNRIYQHAALTLPEFRNCGVNNFLWKQKMKKIKEFANKDTELISINPSWIPGACIMANKLQRIGFKLSTPRPDGATFLKANFLEVCDV